MRNENFEKIIHLFLVALVLCSLPAANSAETQILKPMPVEDAVGTLGFADLMPTALSADGEWLAYTVRNNRRSVTGSAETWARTGVRDVHTGTDIWISNTRTGETRNLTGEKGDNFLPVWSPDGRYLGFISDRDGSGQARLWVWE